MGIYDDILIDGRHGQTKALGRGLRTLGVGDVVALVQAPLTEEEMDGYYAGTWNGLRPETTFQCGVYPGGWLVVVDGVLRDWVDSPVDGIPLFSNIGRSLE